MSHVSAPGCVPLTAARRKALEKAASGAVPMPDYLWQLQGEMPVIKWDARFEKWLDRRIELAGRYAARGFSLLPWQIFEAVPAAARRGDIFAWDQGNLPSCSMHGAVHAYQCAALTAIALGAPLFYEPLNPIYPFYGARGGNLAGGLDLWAAADWVNRRGLTPAWLVGADNRRVRPEKLPFLDEAKRWQGAIVLIEDDFARKIVRACRALCAVSFGSGRYFTRARTDRNGIKVMAAPAAGGHAQCFAGWRAAGGTEYVFNLNSHGDIYGRSGEGEPAAGAWVTEEQLGLYARDMEVYGFPYIVFPEGEFRREPALANEFQLPRFPAEFVR